MYKTINLIALLFISLLISRCIDVIEFERPEALKNAITIQGKLIKGNPSQVSVSISTIFDFAYAPRFITAKYVQLIDEEENILELKTRQQGVFELDIPNNHPTFKIDYGKAYKIRLLLNNNQMYQSTYDTLYPVPEPTSLNLKQTQKETLNSDGKIVHFNLIDFSVSTPLSAHNNSKKTYFLWELESVFKQFESPSAGGVGYCVRNSCPRTINGPKTCFLSINPVKNYKVLDATNLSGDYIEDFTLLEETANTFVFAEGYYLTVYQQSLSQAAYEYWLKVNLVVNRIGTQYESPAGKIHTNISNVDDPKAEVYGYFFVTESKLKRIYVSPEFAGNPRTQCPPPPLTSSVLCCNCLCQPNSTTTKPEWWEE